MKAYGKLCRSAILDLGMEREWSGFPPPENGYDSGVSEKLWRREKSLAPAGN
jgi:hypothetical protein